MFKFQNCCKPRKSKPDIKKIAAEKGLKEFSLKTLSSATEDFHDKNKLGEGGFGCVFKGKLTDGTEIAVKKPLQNSEELVAKEMELLLESSHHRNIVKLLGFCSEGKEKLLVFEFASNGSLLDLAFKTGRADALNWERTYDIIVGVAQGLFYLHEQSNSVIIHLDIKHENILLDKNWVPKIADFGAASLIPQGQTQIRVEISQVIATRGYSAYEYLEYGLVSPKADIYSFGVVVLELISGKKYWNSNPQSSNDQGLRDEAIKLYEEENVLQFVDQKLISSVVLDQVQLCVKIGVMCTRHLPTERPTMGGVHLMLLNNLSSSSSTLVEEPMSDGASSSTARNSDIHLENKGQHKHRRRSRSRRIQPEDLQSNPSSSCSSGNGIQIESEERPVLAAVQEVAAAAEDEEGIPIPMITKEDPIETGKLSLKDTARQSREKTPLPPAHMTKQTKEAAKKVAKQKQMVEEEPDKKHPTTLNDTEKRPLNSTPEDKVIMPEIKVDKERLAADDAKEDFWQAITKLKCLETSFKKSLNDEGNKSSQCKEGFFEEGEEGKYKDQLTNPQDAILTNNWEGISRKVGVAEDSLLFSEVPHPGLVEQQAPTAEEAVDDGDHGGESVADSNG
ncbi:putative receptor-like protein kinase At4g00960 isoform X1 [Camellia sinensis]|uniref:putative receptor-like protein kinase At4g00960 isoform X1 n=1 Tax=Camellia sinensis TaxID=4442 RepID=UPI001035C959|nr:putative receptor-like protein kinase At4g00960 isoform X1 [Camellia sinensis]